MMKELSQERMMTVKELADVLSVAESTVRNKVSEMFPEIVRNGVATYLNEQQATEIKKAIVPRDLTLKSKLENSVTDVEMMERAQSVQLWMADKIRQLRAENTELTKTVNILTHVNKTYTATEIAKELNMRSAQELNKELEKRGIQYQSNGTWVMYSKYSSLGYEEIKQKTLDSGKVVYDRHFTQIGREFIIKMFSD
jgi:anti-repressor protein